MVYTPSNLGLTRTLRADSSAPGDLHHGDDSPGMRGGGASARMRTCEISYLRSDARIGFEQHSIPPHPVFDGAFSAFARGTLITTTRGPVAIEDLDPGMRVVTNERSPSPILWIGRMTWQANRNEARPEGARLTRIQTGALGLGRPLADVLTGPGARTLQRADGWRGNAHADQTLRPIHDMIDGTHVIALSPPGDVVLFHIALRRHATITAAGLAVETYHPGPGFENQLTYQQLSLFLRLFPHVLRPADFGSLAHPRAPLHHGGRAIA
ncbi:MAG: Hint domain-containing protein [Roseovarius sp.]